MIDKSEGRFQILFRLHVQLRTSDDVLLERRRSSVAGDPDRTSRPSQRDSLLLLLFLSAAAYFRKVSRPGFKAYRIGEFLMSVLDSSRRSVTGHTVRLYRHIMS